MHQVLHAHYLPVPLIIWAAESVTQMHIPPLLWWNFSSKIHHLLFFCKQPQSHLGTPLCFKAIIRASFIQRDPTRSHTNYFHFNCNMLVVPTAIKICWPHTTHPKQQHHPLVPCHHFHPLNYGKPQKIQRIQIASTAISVLMPLIKFITTSLFLFSTGFQWSCKGFCFRY